MLHGVAVKKMCAKVFPASADVHAVGPGSLLAVLRLGMEDALLCGVTVPRKLCSAYCRAGHLRPA